MAFITTRITVAADGTVAVAAPIPQGEYTATLETAKQHPASRPISKSDFPQLDTGPWRPGRTFSRDEIYGDDGR